MNLLVYGYWRSSSSWRVRIALGLKNVPHEVVSVDLRHDAQWSPEHRARSPMSKVPVLELADGRVITESMAIIHWLDAQFPTPPLLPADPYLAARSRMIAEMINSGIQPFQNLQVQKYIKHTLGADEKVFTSHFIKLGLEALEPAIAPTAGRFAVGDAPSLADIYLVPQLDAARRFDVKLSPLLERIEQACADLPAFQKARPENQPDAER